MGAEERDSLTCIKSIKKTKGQPTRLLDNMTTLSAWVAGQLIAHLGAGSVVRGISEPQAQHRKVLNCRFLVVYITKLVSMEDGEGRCRKVEHS